METIALMVIAAVLAVATYWDRKDKFRELVLSFAAGIIDEAIAISEIKNIYLKREAVFNATKAWQKQKPEVLKDQIAADKFLQEAMVGARGISHDCAKAHIIEVVSGLPSGRVKTSMLKMFSDAAVIDKCIKVRIAAAKVNIADPIKPFLYRYL